MKKSRWILTGVLLGFMLPTQAAIINTYYSLNHNLWMTGRPSQSITLTSGDDYNNTLTQSATTCIPAGPNACLEVITTATSTMIFHQDLDAGVISGSYAWDHSQSYYSEPGSWAGESLQAVYDLTTPYRYTIEVSGSAVGTAQGPLSASIEKGGGSFLYESATYGPISFYETGIIDYHPSITRDLWINMSAWACGSNGGCSQVSSSGNLNFSITLTPVPLPAAAWLLLSGLGGLGAIARRRCTV